MPDNFFLPFGGKLNKNNRWVKLAAIIPWWEFEDRYATCAPSDIRYPTDLRMLNEAREKLEEIIDVLHEPDAGKEDKPHTYREKARKQYLSIEKQRKKHKKAIRKAVKKQLGYLKRDLAIIQRYLENTNRYELLSSRQKKQYETIKKLVVVLFQVYICTSLLFYTLLITSITVHNQVIVLLFSGAEIT